MGPLDDNNDNVREDTNMFPSDDGVTNTDDSTLKGNSAWDESTVEDTSLEEEIVADGDNLTEEEQVVEDNRTGDPLPDRFEDVDVDDGVV